MKISDLAVDRPVAVTVVIMLILLIGGVSLTKLPIDLMPDLDLPYAVVSTSYSGAGPEEVEKTVTKPIEETLATVDGIKNLSSTSSAGNSIVILELDWGSDLNFATLDIREKLSLIEDLLPEDAAKPMVLKFDPNQMPIMQIGLSGAENLDQLKAFAEDVFKPNLERISGVASVNVTGGLEREIKINVDQEKLIAYGLSLNQVASSVRGANLDMSGGTINQGDKELLLKTIGEFESVEELRNVEIAIPQGGSVLLSDIAVIKDDYKEVSNYTYLNGKKSIGLEIQKQSGTNTVKVANQVEAELARLSSRVDNDINVETVVNQAQFIEKAIANVQRNAIVGALLAVIILFVFLKDFRSTLIIGTAIPISVITAFVLMYFAGLSLNLMTLGGIALGVGMLVDNAIVVLENIYRHRQAGVGMLEAAKQGTSEVGGAILASTLTTGAVFLPIAFVQGLASELFGSLALTVTFSLVASLFVALTLIPMLSSKLLKVKESFTNQEEELEFGKVTKLYQEALKWSISHKYAVVGIIICGLLFFGAGIKLGIIPLESEFIPATDQGTFNVNLDLPEGTNLEKTDEVIREVEDILDEIKEVDIVYSSVGSSGNSGMGAVNKNSGSVAVELVDLDNRERSTDQVVEEVRSKVKNIAGAGIKVVPQTSVMGGGSGGAPVQVIIQGSDLEELSRIGNQILKQVKAVEGTRNVDISLEESKPEVQIKVQGKVANRLGFTKAQIASAVRSAVRGQTISKYKEQGEEYDITLKLKDSETNSINRLRDLKLTSAQGITVPLSQVAEVKLGKGPNAINREGQQRKVTVSTALHGRSLSAVQKDIRNRVTKLNLPAGYTVDYSGEVEQMQDSFGDLGFALVMAVILVYMVMAIQFESFIYPLTIMFTVPLALVGALLGLAVTRAPLSVPGIIGMIMLAGIVVNNAIVLVDYINTRRQEESREEAILKAGPIRLRPIMMTTLTTILGLLPVGLGIGEGAETQQPMAVVVIGGLLLATVLTLLVIPAIYSIFDDLTIKFKSKISQVV